MRFRDLPLTRKLTAIIAIATGIGLLLSLAMFSVAEIQRNRAAMQSQLTGIAQIVAANTASAIEFKDAKAAATTLSGLRARPEITGASITLPDGKVFARFPETGPAVMPRHSGAKQEQTSGGFWDVWMMLEYPVRQENEVSATQTLDADLTGMWRDVLWGFLLGGLGTALAFGVALAARLQRSISGPILMHSYSGQERTFPPK